MKIFNLILFFLVTAFTLVGQKDKGTFRIIGGEIASDNPGYVVSLHSDLSGYIGVGVILDSKTIVTAAHVVDNFVAGCQSCVSVRAGSQFISGSTQQTTSSSILLHPDYTTFPPNLPEPSDFDIAIIKLTDEFTFDNDIQPISITRSCIFDSNSFSTGAPVTIFGWGATETVNQFNSNSLKLAENTIYDLVNSQFWIDEPYYQDFYDVNSMYSIYSSSSQGYVGDSGGPCVIQSDGQNYLAGIISWGRRPELSNNPNITYPTIMADVFKMRDFILDNLESGTYACDIDRAILDEYEASIACGETVFDLNGLYSDPVPSGFELRWSLDNYPLDCVIPITNGLVTESGVYYAYYYNLDSDCYSQPSDPVMVSLGCTSMNNLVVDSNLELVNDQTFNSIEIRNGATLEIKNNVRISIIDKVVVKYSSKLVIDGGILTNCITCPKWQGVIIETNPSPFGSTTGRGVVIRNGGTIEYAKNGVYKSLSQGASAGNLPSLKMISGATIRNCETGVYFSNSGNSLGFLGEQETSIIDDAFFKENDTSIKLRFSNGLTLNRNTFEENHYGVEVTNSKVDIYDNYFFGTNEHIFINALYPSLVGINIERNAFSHGWAIKSESLNNVDYLFIKDNTFSDSDIETHGLSRFVITANDFIDNGGQAVEHCATGDALINQVYNNYFGYNYVGVNVDGINNVEFLTNCFESTTRANIGLASDTKIRITQGAQTDEAGNCFDSGGRRLVTSDINPANEFLYYKFEPGAVPNFDCKEPNYENVQYNYDVNPAFNEIIPNCGTGSNIFGADFPVRMRDCTQFVYDNKNDEDELDYLISSLEDEIDRLWDLVLSENLSNDVYQILKNKYLECIDLAKSQKLITILSDPSGDPTRDPIKKAITFLKADTDFRYNIMAYSLMMNANEYVRASQYLNTLSTEREDQDDFIDVQNIYLSYLMDRNGFTLSENDRLDIYAAGVKRLPLAGFARSVYYDLTGQRILLDVPIYDDSRPFGKSRSNKDELGIDVFPNPSKSNEAVNINIKTGLDSELSYTVSIYNTQGTVIEKRIVKEGNHEIPLPETSGILFITVTKGGKIVYTDKILRI